MLLRALTAFLALPGMVAGLVPLLLVYSDPYRGGGSPLGLLGVALGLSILLWCVRDFYVAGRGTLAPWDPPRSLVLVGLYRHLRNPMYVGVLCILLGWAVTAGSPFVACFTAFMGLFFHVMVTTHEEPRAEENFGDDWRRYSAEVRRWWPRLKGYRPR